MHEKIKERVVYSILALLCSSINLFTVSLSTRSTFELEFTLLFQNFVMCVWIIIMIKDSIYINTEEYIYDKHINMMNLASSIFSISILLDILTIKSYIQISNSNTILVLLTILITIVIYNKVNLIAQTHKLSEQLYFNMLKQITKRKIDLIKKCGGKNNE